ncbi:hypothetical protein [Streptomyces puniciscabiei]|uniref:hypothetical protein n=1 Tax=Streptomyces puniciscabiei TaxID=164348 RepID=UPI0037BDBAEB
MVVDRLPGGAREFASYLDGLLARLDRGAGWSGVFWQRDPDGMRACLDGREVPPWDVVEALLEDLAAAYGSAAAAAERERARALYRAALTAYDARPGARDALLDRLDVMLREQRYAAERHSELARLLSAASVPEDADSLRLDLAWAQDDHDRATARCAELRSRLTELDRRAAVRARGVRHRGETGPSWAGGGVGAEGAPAEVPPRFRQARRDGRAVEGEQASDTEGSVWAPHTVAPASAPHAATSGRIPGAAASPRASDTEGSVWAPHTVAPASAPHAATSGRIPGAAASPQASDTEGSVWAPHTSAPAPPPQVPGPASAPNSDGSSRAPRDVAPGPEPHADGSTRAPYAAASAPAPRPVTPDPSAAPSPDAGQAAQTTSLPAQAAAPSPGARQDGQRTPASPRTVHAPESPLPTHAPAAPTPAPRTLPVEPQAATPPPSSVPGKPRKRRRGSARFAGMVEEGAAAAVVVPPAAPAVVPEAPARRTPRGARFAGAAQAAESVAAAPVEVVDAEAEVAVTGVVERLGRLRAEGRSGEAHVLLVEVVQWPPGRFPALADALHRAGLGADWATLPWETASLPAERLVAAADALTAAGREADGLQLLRQGVARPAEQIGAAVLRLEEEGRRREAAALLDACVRGRTAEEAARSVVPDPRRLVPLLLHAAQAVSEERHWDLVHALRVAGHTT